MMLKVKDFWNKYKSSKKAWAIAIVLVIIVLLIATHKKTTSAIQATATTGNVVEAVSVSGRTQSASAVDLGFADQGRVTGVYAREGDKVSEGRLLASIDTSDLEASLQNAKASLVIARADMNADTTNLQKLTQEQNALVENAYRNLLSVGLEAVPDDLTTTATPPTITGIYNGPEGDYHMRIYSSSATSGASFELSGLETGFTQSVISNTSVPLGSRGLFIRFASDSTPYQGRSWTISVPNKRSATYATYLNAYESAKATRDRVLADAQAGLSANGMDSSVAQARVDQAQSTVNSILSQIGKRRIIAPFSGVVANVNIKPGQTTSAASATGATVGITLISENDYEIALKVPEINVAKLSVGQIADITLDAYGKDVHFEGKIISINPAETIVDGVPVYETKVVFTKPDVRIRSGMTATATIVTNKHDTVVTIPASFVHADKDGSYVYIAGDKKSERRAVVTGLRGSDSQMEIVSGLTAGEIISSDEVK